MNVRRSPHGLAVLLALASLPATGFAQDARGLDNARIPDECWTLFVSVGQIAQARENGVPKARIVEFARSVEPKYAVPAQAIEDVYELTDLDRGAFEYYWLLACQARAAGVPIAPLKSVHTQFRECRAKSGDREQCGQEIRNALLGLPKDYVPERNKGTAIRSVPVPPPPSP